MKKKKKMIKMKKVIYHRIFIWEKKIIRINLGISATKDAGKKFYLPPSAHYYLQESVCDTAKYLNTSRVWTRPSKSNRNDEQRSLALVVGSLLLFCLWTHNVGLKIYIWLVRIRRSFDSFNLRCTTDAFYVQPIINTTQTSIVVNMFRLTGILFRQIYLFFGTIWLCA